MTKENFTIPEYAFQAKLDKLPYWIRYTDYCPFLLMGVYPHAVPRKQEAYYNFLFRFRNLSIVEPAIDKALEFVERIS